MLLNRLPALASVSVHVYTSGFPVGMTCDVSQFHDYRLGREEGCPDTSGDSPQVTGRFELLPDLARPA